MGYSSYSDDFVDSSISYIGTGAFLHCTVFKDVTPREIRKLRKVFKGFCRTVYNEGLQEVFAYTESYEFMVLVSHKQPTILEEIEGKILVVWDLEDCLWAQ